MRKLFSREYDAELACVLCDLYMSGDKSVLNDLMKELFPLIRMKSKMELNLKLGDQRNDMEADALMELHKVLTTQEVPYHNHKVFTRYISVIVRRSFSDSIRKMKSQSFDFLQAGVEYRTATLPSASGVEFNLYKIQVSRLVRREVKRRIRFTGSERKACLHILDCELGNKKLDPITARRIYPMSQVRCKYFIDYVNILLRAVLWEYGERERKDGTLSRDWATS